MTWVPQLIYSCVDRTLHLFIVYIYLLGSWISPAVHLHSSACILWWQKRCCWQFVCGFYCYHEGIKQRKWNLLIGLLDYCAFYQIGCVQHLVLSVHSYCVLIVCFYLAKPVHTQSWKPTCSHFCLTSSVTHKTNGMRNHPSTAPALAMWHQLIQTAEHTLTAVVTICHIAHKRGPAFRGFYFGSGQLRNTLNCTHNSCSWKLEKQRKQKCKGGSLYLHHPLLLLLFEFQF